MLLDAHALKGVLNSMSVICAEPGTQPHAMYVFLEVIQLHSNLVAMQN